MRQDRSRLRCTQHQCLPPILGPAPLLCIGHSIVFCTEARGIFLTTSPSSLGSGLLPLSRHFHPHPLLCPLLCKSFPDPLHSHTPNPHPHLVDSVLKPSSTATSSLTEGGDCTPPAVCPQPPTAFQASSYRCIPM